MKKFLSWSLSIFFALSFIIYMPSFASLLFLALAIVTLPIEKIKIFLERLVPSKIIRIIAFLTVFVAGCNLLPTSNTNSSHDLNASDKLAISNTETAKIASTEEYLIDEPPSEQNISQPSNDNKKNEPMEEKTTEPVKEKAPEPVKEKAPEPVKEKAPDPVKEEAPDPVKEVTPEPVEQTTSEAPEVDNNTITHSNNYTESTSVVEDTVYITPTGKKYHYSASCAGKNAMPRSLSDASATYGPCKKCAQ